MYNLVHNKNRKKIGSEKNYLNGLAPFKILLIMKFSVGLLLFCTIIQANVLSQDFNLSCNLALDQVAAGHDHCGTFFGQGDGCVPTDAAVSACDDGYLSRQVGDIFGCPLITWHGFLLMR